MALGWLTLPSGPSVATGTPLSSHSVAAWFNPLSVTFVSLNDGLALGTSACGTKKTCLALRRTNDGGRTWYDQALPSSILNVADRVVDGSIAAQAAGVSVGLNIRFADQDSGWIYGSIEQPQVGYEGSLPVPVLWSTHDGGLVWQRMSVPGVSKKSSILDLEVTAGTVDVLTLESQNQVEVESSPASANVWRKTSDVGLGTPAGGGPLAGGFTLQGGDGWLVEGNDRGTTGSAQLTSNGTWVAWRPPCRAVGDSYVVPAASTPRDLVAVCGIGGFGGYRSKAEPPGSTLGSSWLYFSTNGGETFSLGPELRPLKDYLGFGSLYGVLASPAPGVIFLSRELGNDGDVVGSFDGGAHWSVAYGRQLLYLGFTSATQGVGIASFPHGVTRMIMTYDGGHTWSTVTF